MLVSFQTNEAGNVAWARACGMPEAIGSTGAPYLLSGALLACRSLPVRTDRDLMPARFREPNWGPTQAGA